MAGGNRWSLEGNRWRLVGNRWRLVDSRWRLEHNQYRWVYSAPMQATARPAVGHGKCGTPVPHPSRVCAPSRVLCVCVFGRGCLHARTCVHVRGRVYCSGTVQGRVGDLVPNQFGCGEFDVWKIWRTPGMDINGGTGPPPAPSPTPPPCCDKGHDIRHKKKPAPASAPRCHEASTTCGEAK